MCRAGKVCFEYTITIGQPSVAIRASCVCTSSLRPLHSLHGLLIVYLSLRSLGRCHTVYGCSNCNTVHKRPRSQV